MKALHTTPRFIGAAVALAVTAVLAAAPAHAQQPNPTQQTDERPLTRAEVNEQTVAAMKSGEIVSGEGRPQGPESVVTPTKTREERKAETIQAIREHKTMQPGESA